jgi:hypothetical protein
VRAAGDHEHEHAEERRGHESPDVSTPDVSAHRRRLVA